MTIQLYITFALCPFCDDWTIGKTSKPLDRHICGNCNITMPVCFRFKAPQQVNDALFIARCLIKNAHRKTK